MSTMGKLKYPPCSINPMTEKPYVRHRFDVPETAKVRLKKGPDGEILYYYRVRCTRCGLNDPDSPSH